MDEGEDSIKLNKVKNRIDNIAITLLGEYAFCQYTVFLREVRGVTPRFTQAMRDGIQAHKDRNKLLLLATKQISIKDATLQAKSDGIVTVRRNVIVNGAVMHGKMDVIDIGQDEIRIIDYKPGLKAHQSSINQVRAYCVVFHELFNPEQQIIGVIENLNTQNVIWEEPYSEDTEKDINGIVERIRG